MAEKQQADQIIAQGRRAIERNNMAALKAANWKLIAVLIREAGIELDANVGGLGGPCRGF